MTTLRDALGNWLPEARSRLSELETKPTLEHVGTVEYVGDGVASVAGLPRTRIDELLRFETGALGLALRVDRDRLGCILLSDADTVVAGTRVRGTGGFVRVPVGEALLGRTVDPLGRPLDGGPAVESPETAPIDRPAPAIAQRERVTEPMMTGLTVVDAMIPLGRGQRELIVGDRKTGKTALAVDAMINQRASDVICVYAAIGQKSSTVGQVIAAVREHGAIDRCVFVVGEPDSAPGLQWIAPYAACSIAEYFRDRGRDALLVIDDLTKHAIIYRQLSLLLRNPPGREAYPGDIFYVHARLLERAAKLSEACGGGSLTAFPIAETQAGNLSAYIPTNLISITDGQIYLEPKLFYEGQKPAVNVGLSVSRVGGQTQAPAMKRLAETLRLDYSQFLELEVFTRLGAITDERTRRAIEHGRRIRAILTQPEHGPVSLPQQVALLLAVSERRLDAVPLEEVDRFKTSIGDALAERCPRVVARLEKTGDVTDEDRADLLAAIDDCLAAISVRPGGTG